jgi:hypothetical protein
MRRFVFGYGSLAADLGGAPTRAYHDHGFTAVLSGFTRGWGVAMDNRRDLPGYKYYTAPDGIRPPVHVAFLDIAAGDGEVNGLCLPVDDAALAELDSRERNYERVDVSDRLDAPGARVYAYAGRPEARARLSAGRAGGTAVIHAGYLEAVRRGFASLGGDELAQAEPSLDPDGLPVCELIRHELS